MSEYCLIPLSGKHGVGKFAKVSPEDYEFLSQWSWCLQSEGYAWRSQRNKGGAKAGTNFIYLHRVVVNPPQGYRVDHIDGDRLNDVRENLRVCTHRQNLYNMVSKTGISRFKGVSKGRPGKWRAYIKVDNAFRSLGSYVSEEDAARAYDAAARLHFGEFAKTNF